jgi:hypothetical protein
MSELVQFASLDTPEDARLRARMLKKNGRRDVDPYRNFPVNERYAAVRMAFTQEMYA